MSAPTKMADFVGKNGQFAGGVVHSVAPQKWIDDVHVPGPACHTPNGTFDPSDFKPTDQALSCRRCKKWHPGVAVDAVQLNGFPDLAPVAPVFTERVMTR